MCGGSGSPELTVCKEGGKESGGGEGGGEALHKKRLQDRGLEVGKGGGGEGGVKTQL